MNEPDQEFTREILRKVRQIEIRSNRLVSEALAGSYHSAFKGQGIDFEEVREYQAGDEVRSIDWNVTAKMGSPFVKQYREERELTILLAIDVSGSETFGSSDRSKRERLAELGALLAFSANRNGDKVGLLLFSDQTEKYLPPNKGQKHVLRILREILFHENQSKGTDLNEGLRFINRVMRRRAVVFLLSDFIIPEYETEEESVEDLFFKELAATRRKHDLVCARIHDSHEMELPNVGVVHLEDSESGEKIYLDTSSRSFRESYAKRIAEDRERFNKRLRRRGVDNFEFSTDSDYVGALREFFRMRETRRSR
ncbi:MAG TPA: DUF58 domain-containing protein [Opitutae bacterium]|nr:DUF58 domain-containing protein [Opitutae bacterium]|tara:strand:+ start:953 stop:1885 length:933 start_codon:yes stop_codon:yes gene_type:complete